MQLFLPSIPIETKQKIFNLWEEGVTMREIKKEIPLSSSTIIEILKNANDEGILKYDRSESLRRSRIGIKKNFPLTQSIIELWDQGFGTKYIVEKVGVKDAAVHERIVWAQEQGLCNYSKKENDKRNGSFINIGKNNPNKKAVKCIETGAIYESAPAACRELGWPHYKSLGICTVCNKK